MTKWLDPGSNPGELAVAVPYLSEGARAEWYWRYCPVSTGPVVNEGQRL